MSTYEQFNKGKRGKELDPVYTLVRVLNTWSVKTLIAHIVHHDHDPVSRTDRMALVKQLANIILKDAKE